MVASIQPACLVYRVQMRPAFIHPRIDISGRLANLKASANRSRNHIRFNHARFNSVQQQTLPAAFVADIFGRYPLRLRKWPNSSLDSTQMRVTTSYWRACWVTCSGLENSSASPVWRTPQSLKRAGFSGESGPSQNTGCGPMSGSTSRASAGAPGGGSASGYVADCLALGGSGVHPAMLRAQARAF